MVSVKSVKEYVGKKVKINFKNGFWFRGIINSFEKEKEDYTVHFIDENGKKHSVITEVISTIDEI